MSQPPPEPASAVRSQRAATWLVAVGTLLLAVPQSLVPGTPYSHSVLWLMAAALTPVTFLHRLEVLPGTLLVLAGASLAWSVDAGQSAFTLMMWLGWGALVLASGVMSGPVVAVAVCVALVLMQAQALSQWMGGLDAAQQEAGRAGEQAMQGFAALWASRRRVLGPFASPDMLAGFALPLATVPLALALPGGWPRSARMAAGAVAAGTLLMVVAAQSAGAALSLALALALVAVPPLWRARAYKPLLAVALVALGVPLAVLALRGGLDPDTAVSLSAQQRLADWSNAVHIMGRTPLWGVGAGAFEGAFNAFSPPRRYAAYVHNATLQLAVELGPLGGLLMAGLCVLLLGFAVRRAREGDAADRVLAVGVAAGAIHQQLDYDLHTLAGAGLFVCAAFLRARAPRAGLFTLPPAARFWFGSATLAAAWLCAGMALTERGVPRLQDDVPALDQGRRGAALLSFDAHAQVSLAQDLALAAMREPDPQAASALWGEHDRAALRAASLAPLMPAGPMMLARGLMQRRQWEQALPVYTQAVARACCSRRLHEERLQLARALGQPGIAAQDEEWLAALGVPVPAP